MSYLDNTGVGTLWNRIKTYIAGLGFYTKPTTGIPATDIASGVIPTVPTNVSAFTNDAGYITGYTETDPTVPAWAKASTKPSYTASEVGALPDDTPIPSKVSDLTNDSGFITSSDLEEKGYLQAVYDSMVTTFGLSYGGYTTEEIESPEWQYVLVDSGDRIVAGIKMNGTIYFPNLKVETT